MSTDLAALVDDRLSGLLPRRDGSERATTLGAGGYDIEAGRAYLAATVEDGLALPTWPQQYGGRDAPRSEAAEIASATKQYVVPDLYPFRVGTNMAGPVLLEHGTIAQRDRWVRNMASGAEIWCQMFSEPDAGSDLANVSTTAVRDGDGWRLNGQKVWTSRGEYADWGICLTRTNPDVPKHNGLTMFALDMRSPGVLIRPLVQMNGDSHFSEVFLDDAFVPDEQRIGEAHGGWAITLAVLAHERAGADRSAPTVGGTTVPLWLSKMIGTPALADPVLRDRAMRLYAFDETIRLTQLRAVANQRAGRKPGPEGSGMKLNGARSFKARAALQATAGGAHALLSDWDGHVDLLTAPSMSIRGGTDEIQLNILAERILGLPSDQRNDRSVPWAVARRGIM